MARIQIDPRPSYPFSTDVQIYISLINYGQHLDNAQLLGLVSEARYRFFQWLGYREFDIEGLAIVVGDMAAQYRSEAFHGETLCVQMAAADLNKYGFDICWRVTEKVSGREVALGKVGVVLTDPATRKVALLPEALKTRLLAR